MSAGNVVQRILMVMREGRLLGALRARLSGPPVANHVRWHGARNDKQAVEALAAWGTDMASDGGLLLVVGSDETINQQLGRALSARKLRFEALSLESVEQRKLPEAGDVCGILCTAVSAREQTKIARQLNAHPELAYTRFEYVSGLDSAEKQFYRWDEYADTFFVSPVLQNSPSPYEIYAESLERFEQKCGLRDFLDLYQVLEDIVRRNVPGDIAEFGSYKGHSGWLIARSLQALGSDKRIWMFDMFESFPDEHLGVDQFWSSTHEVDFAEVSSKLKAFTNVQMVKGDFTTTLSTSAVESLALAYIDCDSYRATRYLLEEVPDRYLSIGGLMVCEDYGHPALLGNRVAVHDLMDRRQDFARQFSQFSGLYMFTKLTESHP